MVLNTWPNSRSQLGSRYQDNGKEFQGFRILVLELDPELPVFYFPQPSESLPAFSFIYSFVFSHLQLMTIYWVEGTFLWIAIISPNKRLNQRSPFCNFYLIPPHNNSNPPATSKSTSPFLGSPTFFVHDSIIYSIYHRVTKWAAFMTVSHMSMWDPRRLSCQHSLSTVHTVP